MLNILLFYLKRKRMGIFLFCVLEVDQGKHIRWYDSIRAFPALLTPFVLARKALGLMNTDHLAALGTGPLFLFVSHEMPYAEASDILQIFNHAHSILGSIPLIQMVQPGAGKAVATETILDFTAHYLLTVLDTARNAGLRFETVVTSTAGACLYLSYICATKAAVHSAGCD